MSVPSRVRDAQAAVRSAASVGAASFQPVGRLARRLDGAFSIDESGFDRDIARWNAALVGRVWSIDVEGVADVPDGPLLVVVPRSVAGNEPLVTSFAIGSERPGAVRLAALVEIPFGSEWGRRCGLIAPSRSEVLAAVRRNRSVVLDAKHLDLAVQASMATQVPVVAAAVGAPMFSRRRAVVLGSPQRTTEVGPLAAARLRDAVAAELDRTRLRASARWRLA